MLSEASFVALAFYASIVYSSWFWKAFRLPCSCLSALKTCHNTVSSLMLRFWLETSLLSDISDSAN